MNKNFTKDLEQYMKTQRTARVKHFTEYSSKKQLENAGVLTDAQLEFAKKFVGVFNFALHKDGRYMAITFYKANEDKKYTFLIVDLKELSGMTANSIREAKAKILELVEEQLAADVKNMLDEALAEQETEKEADAETEQEADAETASTEEK